MPTHSEERILPFTAKQLFDLVADIVAYPEFLPWCEAARINEKEGNIMFAELVIHYKTFRERYISRVELNEAEKEISVSLVQGPFKHLQNEWKFTDTKQGHVLVEFDIDFAFRSKLLEKMIGAFFTKACQKMVSAFEARAKELYHV